MNHEQQAQHIAATGIALHGIEGARARVELADALAHALNDAILNAAAESGNKELVAVCFAKAAEIAAFKVLMLRALAAHPEPTRH